MILDDEALDMMKGLESPITIENKDDLITTVEHWKKKVDTLTVVAELADKLTGANVKLVEENEKLKKRYVNAVEDRKWAEESEVEVIKENDKLSAELSNHGKDLEDWKYLEKTKENDKLKEQIITQQIEITELLNKDEI